MRLALELAREAGDDGETPVGCVIVEADGAVVGRGRNRREGTGDATAHAEIEAIREACGTVGDWRLGGCSLYVTLEPCPMCAGAIIMSRISRVFYGAEDKQTGSCGSVTNLFMESFGRNMPDRHRTPYKHGGTQITGGLLAEECSALLSGFFTDIRSST